MSLVSAARRVLALSLALAFAVGSEAGADRLFVDGFEDPSEPGLLAGITAAHNSVRAGVVTSPPLSPLSWDTSLAATAQAWANQCVDVAAPAGLIDHNPNRSAGHPWYVGENIYASTAPSTGAAAVTSWASEAIDYDYANNRCTPGRVCGHYTQLVWRTTTRVGCATSYCPALAFPYSVVCNYGPGGNTGGRPY